MTSLLSQGTPCIKKLRQSINVKLKLKIDLFLFSFQNSTVMIALLLPHTVGRYSRGQKKVGQVLLRNLAKIELIKPGLL
jgi:hypothetical protein